MSAESFRRAYRAKKNEKSATPGRDRINERLTRGPGRSEAPTQVFENEIGYGDPLSGVDSFLSPENAARYLDVSRKFIYEMMARNEIEAVTVGDRLRRIRISTLEKWLKRS